MTKRIGTKVRVNLVVPSKGLVQYNHKTGIVVATSKMGIHRFCKVKFKSGNIVEFPSYELEELEK